MENLRLEIKNLIINALDLEDTTAEDIHDDAPLFEPEGLGLDSIDALEIGVALRKKYKLQIEANSTGNRENFRSINTLVSYVQSQLK
ncbi:MAG: acyl carrier protein [Gammaproteobacteria bacterium]|nr:acyl carrier protein [Gammaproteobacteria bacterium]